jgi:carbon storage regulator CsrA
MPILNRKVGERIVEPHIELVFTLIAIKGKVVRLGISAPEHVGVFREEIWRGQEADGCHCRNAKPRWGEAGLSMGGLLPTRGRKFPLPPTTGIAVTGRTESRAATARSAADASHLDNLAGELACAAYQAALQHAAAGAWLDLELDLWRALSDAVNIARA